MTLIQRLLLSVPAPASPPRPAPGEMEPMLKWLLSLAPVLPALTPRSAITVRETGLRRLLPPGTLTSVPQSSLIDGVLFVWPTGPRSGPVSTIG